MRIVNPRSVAFSTQYRPGTSFCGVTVTTGFQRYASRNFTSTVSSPARSFANPAESSPWYRCFRITTVPWNSAVSFTAIGRSTSRAFVTLTVKMSSVSTVLEATVTSSVVLAVVTSSGASNSVLDATIARTASAASAAARGGHEDGGGAALALP